ncbi:hypothetical protein [Desulfosporosinus nitroreducens]|uniref:Uncharacterized protein n=1 Tax=Desulfosporosinus nitroreducens TaxID=2018668 RepID=A0ABT8QQ80_9FIRM|nr:hypothetical protein [Desulfosporosinus nitroreducens]MDO0823508.1 hypothetical protein [Desulfosporosinus nitroreducens]
MKKLFSIVLTLVLMLSSTMSTFATESTVKQPKIMMIENGFKIESVDFSKKNGQIQKVKITNLETDEVEYLETYLVDGKCSYLATTKNGKIRIEPLVGDKENIAKITNLDTKEVKHLKIDNPTTNKTAPVDSSLTPQSASSLPFIFKPYRDFSGSNTASMASVATTAGILISISTAGLMGPLSVIPSGIFAAASTYVINRIDTIYWHSIYANATYNNNYYNQYQTWYYYDSTHNNFKEYTYFDTYTNKWQFR